MSNYGEMQWNDVVPGFKDSVNIKDLFLRLSPGSNVIRILTNPYQYHQHRLELDGGKKYGYRINCSKTKDPNSTCPLCEKNNAVKTRWFIGVIDRKTNTYKILDIGGLVFKGIQKYTRDADWGTDLSSYDIDIVMDPNGGPTGFYATVPKPKKPLSVSDLQLQEANDPSELVRRTTPPTAVQVQSRIDAILEEVANTQPGGVSSSLEKTSSKVESKVESTKADDDFFPNADTQTSTKRGSSGSSF